MLPILMKALVVALELLRIGDYSESIARQVLIVSALEPQPPYAKFVELGDWAVHMLRDAVQAFLQQDAGLATRTMVIEERANTLRTSIIRAPQTTGHL